MISGLGWAYAWTVVLATLIPASFIGLVGIEWSPDNYLYPAVSGVTMRAVAAGYLGSAVVAASGLMLAARDARAAGLAIGSSVVSGAVLEVIATGLTVPIGSAILGLPLFALAVTLWKAPRRSGTAVARHAKALAGMAGVTGLVAALNAVNAARVGLSIDEGLIVRGAVVALVGTGASVSAILGRSPMRATGLLLLAAAVGLLLLDRHYVLQTILFVAAAGFTALADRTGETIDDTTAVRSDQTHATLVGAFSHRREDSTDRTPTHAAAARIGGLCLLTGGLYFPWWLYRSAHAMQLLGANVGLPPPVHAVASLMPVLGFVRVHRHFATLNDLSSRLLRPERHPAVGNSATAIVAGTAQFVGFANGELTLVVMGLFAGALLGFVAASGERSIIVFGSTEAGAL